MASTIFTSDYAEGAQAETHDYDKGPVIDLNPEDWREVETDGEAQTQTGLRLGQGQLGPAG